MPTNVEDILRYCVEAGISSIELMGDVVEKYAGIPEGAPRPPKGVQLTNEQSRSFLQATEKAKTAQRDWRISLSMDKYTTLLKMFNDAGVNIHIVKFAPADWSNEEVDYAFKAAKVLGAFGITNEIGEEAYQRFGLFAEKHDIYDIFHNHGQPGEPPEAKVILRLPIC